MRVKLTSRWANAHGNWNAGDVVSVTTVEGEALVRAKAGVALQDPPAAPVAKQVTAPEAAVIEPTETATLPRPRGRPRRQES